MRLPRRRIIVGGISVEGKEARRLLRDAFQAARRQSGIRYRPVLLCLLGGLIGLGAYSALAVVFVPAWPAPWRTVAIGLGGVLLGIVLGRILMVVHLRAHQQEILRAMHSRGYELCTNCGYWLKGLADNVTRCPECGWRREEPS